MPEASDPTRVFLCHAGVDKPIVRLVQQRLNSVGIRTWFDLYELDVGDELLPSITKGIDSSTFIAVFLSESSLTSKWVNEELRIAFSQTQDAKKKILPVLLDPLRDDQLPGYIRGLRYADLTDRTREAMAATVASIVRAIGRFGGNQNTDHPLTSVQSIIFRLCKLLSADGTRVGLTAESLSKTTGIPPDIVASILEELHQLGLLHCRSELAGTEDVIETSRRQEVGCSIWASSCTFRSHSSVPGRRLAKRRNILF